MKKVKIITATLLIILVTMVAFFGIYGQVQNRMENKVKDYSYAMDIKGTRVIRLKVDTDTKKIIKDKDGNTVDEELTDEEISEKGYTTEETPTNSEEVLTKDNYIASKKLIEKRLKALGVENYITKVDESTGDIVIELTENNNTDSIISDINTVGKFEIIDADTKEVLMDNNDIKLSNVLYNTTSTGTAVYLNIEYTKDGSKKLEDISNKYVKSETPADSEKTDETTTEDQTPEDTSTDTQTTEKKVSMKIDDQEIMSTSFDESITTGKMQLSIGTASTEKTTVNGNVEKAKTMATLLDNGKFPVKYTVDENKYVLSDITKTDLQAAEIAVAIVVAMALVVLIVKFKINGLLGSISYIGLASILLLTIRYANVTLSLEGIFGIVLILILNYIFTFKLLVNLQENGSVGKTTNKTLEKFYIKNIPVCIFTIVCCFIKWIPISSFGMVMFWGLAIMAIYNILITKSILKISEKK